LATCMALPKYFIGDTITDVIEYAWRYDTPSTASSFGSLAWLARNLVACLPVERDSSS
jgi:hypothetical protein